MPTWIANSKKDHKNWEVTPPRFRGASCRLLTALLLDSTGQQISLPAPDRSDVTLHGCELCCCTGFAVKPEHAGIKLPGRALSILPLSLAWQDRAAPLSQALH